MFCTVIIIYIYIYIYIYTYICLFVTITTFYCLCDTLTDPWNIRVYVCAYVYITNGALSASAMFLRRPNAQRIPNTSEC